MTRADLVSLDRPALVALAEEADAVLDTLARCTSEDHRKEAQAVVEGIKARIAEVSK